MDALEDWLVSHCKTIVGTDVSVSSNRIIRSLVRGSLYDLPFGDNNLDLITYRMAVEPLARPRLRLPNAPAVSVPEARLSL